MKRKYKGLGVCGVFLSMAFGKFINAYYGVNGQIAVEVGCLLLILMVIFYLIIKKYFFGAICIFCFSSPLIIGAIGMYLGNLYLVFGAIALFFIVGALVIKFGTKYIENKKKL